MRNRIVALALAAAWTLAGCTTPAPTPAPGATVGTGTAPAGTTAPAATATPTTSSPTAATGSPSPSGGATSQGPIVLSGTSIGGRQLGRAGVAEVNPMLVAKLGRAKVADPQLCESADDRSQLAVVDHSWPGLTVRYGSSGGAAVAVGWTVDLARIPEGVRLADGLAWRPAFATLERLPDVETDTADGRRTVTLTRRHLSWSGPAGATRPDTLSGGAILACAQG